MSKWICIDDIYIPSDENDWEELVAFADAIAEQEPIVIVRCGECKYWDDRRNDAWWSEEGACYLTSRLGHATYRNHDDFCSYGCDVNSSEKPNNSNERSSDGSR